jgi:hypothetical protein
MRIYYLQAEYEPGKRKIIIVWRAVDGPLPEDSPKTAINDPYSVLEIDEKYNRLLCALLGRNVRFVAPGDLAPPTHLPDRFYVNASDQLVLNDTGQVVPIQPNPEKEAFKLSDLYGLSQAQLEAYIDDKLRAAIGGMTPAQVKDYIDTQMASITTLAQAKTVIAALLKGLVDLEVAITDIEKKMAAVELWLVKQTGLE